MTVIAEFAASGLPDTALLRQRPIYSAALATGHGEQDTGAVCAVLERMAGVKRTRSRKR